VISMVTSLIRKNHLTNFSLLFLSLDRYGDGHDCRSCALGPAEFDSQAAD
jgi:hypothetical protein